MEFTIPTDAEVIQLTDRPTRGFEVRDLSGNVVAILLVGDPIKPPPHYRHDLTADCWPEVGKARCHSAAQKRPGGVLALSPTRAEKTP